MTLNKRKDSLVPTEINFFFFNLWLYNKDYMAFRVLVLSIQIILRGYKKPPTISSLWVYDYICILVIKYKLVILSTWSDVIASSTQYFKC